MHPADGERGREGGAMESPRCLRRGPMSPPAPSPRSLGLSEGGGGGILGGGSSDTSKKTVNRKEAKDKVEATAMDVNSNHLSAAPSSSSSSSSSSIVRHLRQSASTEEERRVARLRERLKCVVRDLLRDGRETERCCIQYFPFPLWLFLSLSFCRCSKS